MRIDHTKNIIEVRNLSFGYSKEMVLENVNLDIHKGDYLGVIGPNGGGKSTLIKIILGLLHADTGEVRLFGKNIKDFNEWWKVGYVPQKVVDFDVNFPATVEEVVAMGRYGKKGLFRKLNSDDKKIIDDSLEQVEMLDYKHRIIGDLSGGQQQRVFIARALAAQPEVIFLDEPTAGVDVPSQGKFYDLLKKLNRELELTLVYISHDIETIVHEITELAFVNKTLSYDDHPVEISHRKLEALYEHKKHILYKDKPKKFK